MQASWFSTSFLPPFHYGPSFPASRSFFMSSASFWRLVCSLLRTTCALERTRTRRPLSPKLVSVASAQASPNETPWRSEATASRLPELDRPYEELDAEKAEPIAVKKSTRSEERRVGKECRSRW